MEALMDLPWLEIGVIASLAFQAFERLARLTPTESDDKIVRAMYKVFKVLALDVPNRQK